MTPFEIVLLVCGAVLAVTTVSVVYRMIVGPTILDRAVSTDVLVVMVVMAMALHTAHTRVEWAGPAMLSLTGLAFISTVTFARFVAREAAPNGRERFQDSEEPETTTGPLEAVHLHRADGGPDDTLRRDESTGRSDKSIGRPDESTGSTESTESTATTGEEAAR
ncbi:monovalent cation/H+ antiporter complex subunit F [Brachybacterium sp. p3-SID1565]|uniref:monovalent cation/H+ antiporter complex subunit F n=1 Tax=Brachybacterium sp. p3-SID1565 TaxID=2916046 RepID=UPI0021A2B2D2|nr:monovalent cation/H+ antiporter complex subunit F [Brachybacterium sp. p3-SID1565]MCT1386514.1 monovalent cation/H+ antiporter complex subunit F [Brachybacterium sp. p3-SID1565]